MAPVTVNSKESGDVMLQTKWNKPEVRMNENTEKMSTWRNAGGENELSGHRPGEALTDDTSHHLKHAIDDENQ